MQRRRMPGLGSGAVGEDVGFGWRAESCWDLLAEGLELLRKRLRHLGLVVRLEGSGRGWPVRRGLGDPLTEAAISGGRQHGP